MLAKIFIGNITSWNDPAIKALNPGVNLPSTRNHPDLPQRRLGRQLRVHELPVGRQPRLEVQGRRIDAAPVPDRHRRREELGRRSRRSQATDGAIGYVAVSYIAADSLNEALLQNAAGKFPEPIVDAILAAAEAVTTIQPDGSVPLVNPPASAADAYPMSTYTYAIVPKRPRRRRRWRRS